MAHHNPKVKLEKAPVVEPVKWDPDDHPHAIWCSSYGPDEAMQSTNSLSYIDPKTQAERFDLTLAGSEEGPATGEEEVPSEIASIGQAGCAYTASSLASDQLLLRCCGCCGCCCCPCADAERSLAALLQPVSGTVLKHCTVLCAVNRPNNKSITAMLSGRRTEPGGFYTKAGDV